MTHSPGIISTLFSDAIVYGRQWQRERRGNIPTAKLAGANNEPKDVRCASAANCVGH